MTDNFESVSPHLWSRDQTEEWIEYIKSKAGIQVTIDSRYIADGNVMITYDMKMFHKLSSLGKFFYNDFQARRMKFFKNTIYPLADHSNLSPPLNLNHQVAELIVQPFNCLDEPNGLTNFDSGLKSFLNNSKIELDYSSEFDIQLYVLLVLNNIKQVTNLAISCRPELELFGFRPERLLISSEFPIGIVEIKKPSDKIIDDPKFHGQVLDYLYTLSEMHGLRNSFAIASTYKKFRIYWLPNSNDAAASTIVSTDDPSDSKVTIYETQQHYQILMNL